MKKTLLLSICLLAGAVAAKAQQTLYVIDNATVEHFDGSQLKGKTITDYQISTTGKGNKAVTVHAISTAPSIKAVYGIPRGEFKEFSFPEDLGKGLRFNADSLSLSGTSVFLRGTSDEKVLYIIDGEKSEDASVLRSLAPDRIRSISVLKGRESQERFGTSQPVIVVEEDFPEGHGRIAEEDSRRAGGGRRQRDGQRGTHQQDHHQRQDLPAVKPASA